MEVHRPAQGVFPPLGDDKMATETENQIVVYQPNETVRLDVRLENETVWLTQARLGYCCSA